MSTPALNAVFAVVGVSVRLATARDMRITWRR